MKQHLDEAWAEVSEKQERCIEKYRERIFRNLMRCEKKFGANQLLDDLAELGLKGMVHISDLDVAELTRLAGQVKSLQTRVQELEDRFIKDSSNSHQPPSSDKPFAKKTASLREKSGLKPGGQTGHEGSSRGFEALADVIVWHRPKFCCSCGRDLKSGLERGYSRKQEIEVEGSGKKIVEHRSATTCCQYCDTETSGDFPKHLRAHVQFGAKVRALASYFICYQMISIDRTREIFHDVWGLSISAGTLVNFIKNTNFKLSRWENRLKKELINVPVAGFDETGIRVAGKLRWAHVASTERATLVVAHKARGVVGMNAVGILPEFSGVAVHDGFKGYFSFSKASHALCHAHHLRELKFFAQSSSFEWVKKFQEFFETASKETGQTKQAAALIKRYSVLLRKAYAEVGAPLEWKKAIFIAGRHPKHKKQQKRPPWRCLLDRLRDYKKNNLLFLRNRAVPFTNNQAERDFRMFKVKQKVSGGFRSEAGAANFARIYSFIQTGKKNNKNPLTILSKVA